LAISIKQRVGSFVMVLGLVFATVSLLTPNVVADVTTDTNSPVLLYLSPVSTSISLGSFNGTSQLYVEAVDSRMANASSVFSIPVHGLEEVSFSIPTRGFYQVGLNSSSAVQSVEFSVVQGGAPPDLLALGFALLLLGGAAFSYPYWLPRVLALVRNNRETRQILDPKS
jgi:hypothetical protein